MSDRQKRRQRPSSESPKRMADRQFALGESHNNTRVRLLMLEEIQRNADSAKTKK